MKPWPLTTATAAQRTESAPRRCARRRRGLLGSGVLGARDPLAALGGLRAHVPHVEVGDLADVGEDRGRALGVVGVHVHLQRARVADDEHRVAELLERSDELAGLQAAPGDREVGAVAVGARLVLGVGDAGRRVVRELRRIVAAKRRHDAGEEQRERVAAGVHHAGFAQRRQQLGTVLDRLLADAQRALQHARDHRVLLGGGGRGGKAGALGGVRDVGDDLVRHLARDRQDRALRGVAHGGVGAVGGVQQRRPDQRRVDQLAGPRDELLGGAADELREDHAGVAARAEQRGAGHRLHDLLAAERVHRARPVAAVQAVELLEHRAQRERHVVAGVAVGDREDVEVVDLLAPRFEVRERPGDGRAEAPQVVRLDAPSLGHPRLLVGADAGPQAAFLRLLDRRARAGPACRFDSSVGLRHERLRAAQGAFMTLPAFRHRVHTYTRRGAPASRIRTFCRLGSKRRLVATMEWLRLWPNAGFLPQL